jgi:hypothetical protein
MPRPRAAMRKIRQVLRLVLGEGRSRRQVGAVVAAVHHRDRRRGPLSRLSCCATKWQPSGARSAAWSWNRLGRSWPGDRVGLLEVAGPGAPGGHLQGLAVDLGLGGRLGEGGRLQGDGLRLAGAELADRELGGHGLDPRRQGQIPGAPRQAASTSSKSRAETPYYLELLRFQDRSCPP